MARLPFVASLAKQRSILSCGLPSIRSIHQFVKVSDEVTSALKSGRPVVALESAIYTHGFPYPDNAALACRLESIVRGNGGVPATIGVLNGTARVGLGADELDRLTASARSSETRKISRRDIGYICGLGCYGKRLNGGTTISGTMILAHLVGIQVLATGGLGGVHRGAESSMDISADLTELGRTPLAVVSSGCKSFLDIPRTLEYLETQGASVMTFADGREGAVDFPAFWSRESGVKSPFTIRDEEEAAAIAFAQRNIPIESGILFANPIPKESSIPRDEMELTISQALADAKAAGSSGSENTPFVLNRIRQITDGRTVAANRALIESNVACGTKLAVEISRLGSEERGRRTEPSSDQDLHKEESELSRGKTVRIPKSSSPADPLPVLSSHSKSAERKASLSEVVVAGSVAIDLSCDYLPRTSQDEISRPNLQTSNPASIQQSVGGVGSNVASALQYFGKAPKLCSIVGSDAAGSIAIDELSQRGLRTDGLRLLKEERTARYVAVNDSSRSLMVGMADMRILEQQESLYAAGQLEIDSLTQWIDSKPDWLIVDSNWGPTTMRAWFRAGRLRQARIAVEPVSVAKAKRLFTELPHQAQALDLPVFPSHLIDIATPNVLELASLFDAAKETGHFDREDWFNVINSIDLSSAGSRQKFEKMMGATIVDHGLPQRALHLLPFIPCIITTLGKDGVLLTQLLPPNDSRLTSASAAPYILSRSIAGNLVGGVYMRLFPVPEHISAKAIVSVNGAGDTFLGVLIAALIHLPSRGVEDAIDIAQKASAMTLKSNKAVSPELSALEHLL